MANSYQALQNAHTEDVRWRLLSILNIVPSRPRAESTLSFDLIAAGLPVTDTELRSELDYLEELGLVRYEADQLDRRQYSIRAYGRDVAEYRVACPPGIRRPAVL
ncbi:hypothetical protein [Synechococcus sp. PCC 6312]|uniref:hypothetical protein n=1 Tax=Synechococcus sp. (strain ATCC 27167 / PCC 6312) TaxID=195253 RepID=UPI00029F3AE3|nr:hypothetical protein [Synechococcus sp. PCC 6312]AFY60343.1 hypothetical protein Syn6312_1155 [Synechococcus sp. PCC 6312]